VDHVVVRPVRVLYPAVPLRLLEEFGPGEGGEDGEYGEVRIQGVGEAPQVFDRLVCVPPLADDEHGLGEDAVLLEQPNRLHGVIGHDPLVIGLERRLR